MTRFGRRCWSAQKCSVVCVTQRCSPFQRLMDRSKTKNFNDRSSDENTPPPVVYVGGFFRVRFSSFLCKPLTTDRVSDTTVSYCADVMDVTKMTIVYDDMIFQRPSSV